MLSVWVRRRENNTKYDVMYRVLCDKVEFGTVYAILSRGEYLVDAIPIELVDTIQAV